MQNAQANRRSEPAGGSLPRRWCADITLDFLKRPAEILEHARPQGPCRRQALSSPQTPH